MSIYCQKLKKEAEPLEKAPFPGELGEKILKNISKEGFASWQNYQTILINEHRLSLIDPKAREFLKKEMEKFLFSDEEESMPEAYSPPEK